MFKNKDLRLYVFFVTLVCPGLGACGTTRSGAPAGDIRVEKSEIIYSSHDKSKPAAFDLYAFDLAEKSSRPLVVNDETLELDPTLSRDKTKLAYCSVVMTKPGEDEPKTTPEPESFSLVLRDTGSKTTKVVAESESLIFAPDFSPDGTKLAYARLIPNRGSYVSEVWLYDLQTDRDSRLFSGAFPSWHANGELLLVTEFTSDFSKAGLIIKSVKNDTLVPFSKEGPIDGRWSPKADWISMRVPRGIDTRPAVAVVNKSKSSYYDLSFGTSSGEWNSQAQWVGAQEVLFCRLKTTNSGVLTSNLILTRFDATGKSEPETATMLENGCANLIRGAFLLFGPKSR